MALASPAEVAAQWMAAMRRGDWAEAWRQSDRIEIPRRELQRSGPFARGPQHLRWDGTPLVGRSVLVRCEHGLGDTLQFIRFIPEVSRQARDVTVLVQPHLLALLQGAPGLGKVLNGWTDDPAPPHEVEIEIMELPYALRATLDTLPAPYPHLVERTAGRLDYEWPSDGSLRVGLQWAASEWDSSRSIPLALLGPMLPFARAHFFSLQQGEAAGDASRAQLPIAALSQHTQDVVAAAAAMLELDLVISVDNMVAHLAGTLGRPTWLLLKHEADWRWMEGRGNSPWYPSLRLFRQPHRGDWTAIAAMVGEALRRRAT